MDTKTGFNDLVMQLEPLIQKSTKNHAFRDPPTSEINVSINNEVADMENPEKPKSVSEFRTVLPQILASTAKNLILLDLGMTLAFPTIVIPTLLASKEGLHFSPQEASWFGSIALICQPAGSVVSGLMFEPLGRKRAMLLVNVPHFIAWLMLYFATSMAELYVAAVILGVGIGFMEAPILTYVGEISQPKWRGILTSYSGIFVTMGYSLVFLLGTITDWRTAAGVCAGLPALAILVISQVPESPIWLLNRGRVQDAEKSLCWLRGWVTPDLIQPEFNELKKHNFKAETLKLHSVPNVTETFRHISDNTNETKVQVQNTEHSTQAAKCQHKGMAKLKSILKLNELFRRQTMQPLIVVAIYFFFHHMAGVASVRPFLVKLFEELGSPIDAYVITVVSSVVGIIGNILCMVGVPWIGKKKLSLLSLGSCAFINMVLCIYLVSAGSTPSIPWIPAALYISMIFFFSAGIAQVPWMLLSEIFPFRGRGAASGIAAAISYIIGFITTKTYVDLHSLLTLPGVFAFYGIISSIGCIYFFYFLTETEGKSLQDIETLFEERFIYLKGKLTWKK